MPLSQMMSSTTMFAVLTLEFFFLSMYLYFTVASSEIIKNQVALPLHCAFFRPHVWNCGLEGELLFSSLSLSSKSNQEEKHKGAKGVGHIGHQPLWILTFNHESAPAKKYFLSLQKWELAKYLNVSKKGPQFRCASESNYFISWMV